LGWPFHIERLFRLHRAELERFALRRLGNREAASDVVQDAFLRFAVTVGDRRERPEVENPRAFLFRVTGNLATDVLRHDRVAGQVGGSEALHDDLPSSAPSPETIALDRDKIRRLSAVLDQLPARQRQVLVMKRLHGLSHAEICQRTGLSPAAIEKNLTRALQRLRAAVDDEAG
jgi:RNA polymerase sigma factor (sigma-70 family)